MRCDACQAEVSRESLEYTPEGQALCRPCLGTYLSKVASQDALASGAYRRCTCGAVLRPEGDASVSPVNGDTGYLDLGYFFQSDVYDCSSCGTRFKVQHVVMALLLFAILGVCVYGLFHTTGDAIVLWLLMGAVAFAIAGYDVYCRIRYPRIRSLD